MYLRADHPREVTSLPAEPVAPVPTRAGDRSRKLNATSYVVLGMLCHGPATSYDLKQRSVEQGGRRKRTYSITRAGRKALRDWLATPTHEQTEVRDLGLLKLFFAAFGEREDLIRLARDRYESHRARADGYLRQHERIVDVADEWQLKTLELGLRYERTVEQFWADFLAELEASEGDEK
jgi:virulence activator alpha